MIKIINSKPVFAVYVGLIHAGYDLSDDISAEFIKVIKSLQIDDEVINYFKSAKSDSCKVNPFWPFGFIITYLALYNEEAQVHLNDDLVAELISKLDNIDKSLFNNDVCMWCAKIGSIICKIYNTTWFEYIWHNYVAFSNETRNELKIENSFVLEFIAENNIILILNELQASQLTDFVEIGDKIFIISSKIIESDIIHECLHHFFKEQLYINSMLISKYTHLLEPVYSDMLNYQYAWSKDSDSWIRVFEENLMRAVTVALSGDSEHYKKKTIDMYYDKGFIYCKLIFNYVKDDMDKIKSCQFFEHLLLICDSIENLKS